MKKNTKDENLPRLSQFTMERAHDAILWHDSEARIRHVNRAACELFGYTREALLRMNIQDINPNSTQETWGNFWKELQQKETICFESRHDTKDGRNIPLEVRANFIVFEGREYAVGFCRDISERKQYEAEKTRAYQEIVRLREQLERENEYLQEEVTTLQAFGEIIGQSPALRSILRKIEMVAPTDAGVLIVGESGTGKELIAHEIHQRSQRKLRPMIRVNCASIPGELFESEFFGHVKGAFSGAVKDRTGRFALSDKGTLFLDEVGEIPLTHQSKLLRVLQEGTYERVGDERTRTADVRIIAATNRDLKKEVEKGRFREDLFYRLNVFPIESPPLRERKEDIPLLVNHLLEGIVKKLSRPKPLLTKAQMAVLQNYTWPGNVREMQNVIERAMIISRKGKLHFDLPERTEAEKFVIPPSQPSLAIDHSKIHTFEEIRQIEEENMIKALKQTKGKIFGSGGAAELLGTRPTTLASRISRMGIKVRDLKKPS